MTDKKKRSSSETARRIWLAGIGAYGRAFTEAQGALKEVTGKSSEIFDELVQKGEMLETVGKVKGKEILDKAPAMPDIDLDDRIKAMRARLRTKESTLSTGGPAIPSVNIQSLDDRLQEIERKLDRILATLEPQNKASKKTIAKKKTVARKPVKSPVKTSASTKAKPKTIGTQRTTKTTSKKSS